MQIRVTRLPGVEHPIVSASMGPDMTGPDPLAAGRGPPIERDRYRDLRRVTCELGTKARPSPETD